MNSIISPLWPYYNSAIGKIAVKEAAAPLADICKKVPAGLLQAIDIEALDLGTKAIAIGGIINESTTDTSAGIPILDRIPYLGAAFGTKSSTKKRTELIIFLTPRVIYDTNQVADATQELKDKVKGLKKLIRNE